MMAFMTFVVLVFATYRITRLALFDTILDPVRDRLIGYLDNSPSQFADPTGVKGFFYKLASCSWCAGTHFAWMAYAAWTADWPWQFGREGWIWVFAIAGAAGLAHAYEPE